jgi:hypothetical protein
MRHLDSTMGHLPANRLSGPPRPSPPPQPVATELDWSRLIPRFTVAHPDGLVPKHPN